MTRRVLITGASSGIGAEVARLFLQRGDSVIACARSHEKLDAAVQRFGNERFLPYPLDVTDPVAVTETIHEIEEGQGPIDLALLNAGTYSPTPLETFDAAVVKTAKSFAAGCQFRPRAR